MSRLWIYGGQLLRAGASLALCPVCPCGPEESTSYSSSGSESCLPGCFRWQGSWEGIELDPESPDWVEGDSSITPDKLLVCPGDEVIFTWDVNCPDGPRLAFGWDPAVFDYVSHTGSGTFDGDFEVSTFTGTTASGTVTLQVNATPPSSTLLVYVVGAESRYIRIGWFEACPEDSI